MTHSPRIAAALAALLLAACAREPVETPLPALATGMWQATITLPGGDIDTGFEITLHDDTYQAQLINGQERVLIDEVSFEDGELLLRFPAFNNEIRATLADGALVGELTLVKRFGETQSMPFRAVPGAQRNDPQSADAGYDMSGRWAVTFHEPEGEDTNSIGEFAQRGARLFGTFLNPNGDHRFLAGYVRGDRFKLSTFDGAHAFLFSGTLTDRGIVDADFWSGTSWHQTWSAVRNSDVVLPDAFSRTHLKPGYERFEFSFPDPDGNLVSLDDEKFRGKVVVVTINGTWCPNCNDEARFMAPLYKEHRDRGLEIVALMFEHFEDHESAATQVRHFRDKFEIEYETLIAGISDKTEAGKVLPSLNAVLAFPTTIFIDRAGQVRAIHTGFSGPGTGEHYEQLQESMRSLIAELLAETPEAAETMITDSEEPEE